MDQLKISITKYNSKTIAEKTTTVMVKVTSLDVTNKMLKLDIPGIITQL